jgi:hypothetical protein
MDLGSRIKIKATIANWVAEKAPQVPAEIIDRASDEWLDWVDKVISAPTEDERTALLDAFEHFRSEV